MAMRGIPEYIALARTILHASVGQVQYGPSAGNIFWYPPNIKPCNIIIIIHIIDIRHFVQTSQIHFTYSGCGSILLSINTVSKHEDASSAGLTKFSLHCKQCVMDVIIMSQ